MEEGDYERDRLANIAKNKALMLDLGLAPLKKDAPVTRAGRAPPRKRQKTAEQPMRTSARLANRPAPAASLQDSPDILSAPDDKKRLTSKSKSRNSRNFGASSRHSRRDAGANNDQTDSGNATQRSADVAAIERGWNSWEPTAAPPTRDDNWTFHFTDYPEFQPNKSPSEVLREGAFGGSYFRPLYSKKLGITVRDDWRELPDEWLEGVDPETFLLQPTYDNTINKAGVACGQSIEEWEANGWIAHDYDVRGWFQWYCRFFQGRRCPDDTRQVGRWARCVGPRGRWKRTLLKQYLRHGVRYVNDEGDEDEDAGEVSPVITQTCLHWAYEIRQSDLDDVWANGL